ncbi:MAG: hypothetical protein K9H16_05835 [Bacteroidales bacterium]|nr:hypothetical protein [Bacteroidales bacterium]
MNFDEFKISVNAGYPPETMGKELKALWWDAKGNWDKAHRIVQTMNNISASRVHAYLHRKEGDLNNASFWYTNAGQRMPGLPLKEEWDEIVRSLLKNETGIE